MRSENGIPRPFQPNNLAQKVADLERELAALKARRNFVSVERIVEGGTLNQAVSNQITETVQKDLVVERENIAEGALSVVGETVEAEPKRLTAQLRTVERDNPDGAAETYAAAPSLVFSLEGEGPTAVDPGIYSFDGYSLRLTAPGAGDDPMTYVNVSPGKFQAQAVTSEIGAEFWSRTVTIGNTGLGLPGSPVADVNILGNVKVNGSKLGIQHAEFTTTFSLGSGTTVTKVGGTFTRDNTQDKNGEFATPTGTGSITLQPGVYSIHYRADCGASMGDAARLGFSDITKPTDYTSFAVKAGEWDGALQHPNLYLPATTTLAFNFRQNSGSTRTCNARVIIEKIK